MPHCSRPVTPGIIEITLILEVGLRQDDSLSFVGRCRRTQQAHHESGPRDQGEKTPYGHLFIPLLSQAQDSFHKTPLSEQKMDGECLLV
jgi:hypothetical protein